MNTPQAPRNEFPGAEVLLAFLLLIAFVQIAACFNAGSDLVRGNSSDRLVSAMTVTKPALPVSHDGALTNAQPAGFQSIPARG